MTAPVNPTNPATDARARKIAMLGALTSLLLPVEALATMVASYAGLFVLPLLVVHFAGVLALGITRCLRPGARGGHWYRLMVLSALGTVGFVAYLAHTNFLGG